MSNAKRKSRIKPIRKYRNLIKFVREDGWYQDPERKNSGSHRQFIHPRKHGIVTITGTGNKDVPLGTLNSVLKQAGLK